MSVLCYHTVDGGWNHPLAVDPVDFDEQCRWLSRAYTVLPLDETLRRIGPDGRLPRGFAHLSFDDGFQTLYDVMLPAARRHALPTSVFIVAQTLTPEGQAVDWVDDAPTTPPPTLNREQVLEMQDAGVDFQSHSWAHLDLTELGHAECIEDLKMSRELLEDLLGKRVTVLAYPRGLHDSVVRDAARRAGYRHAFALPEDREDITAFSIPRVGVYRGNSLRAVKVKAARAYLPLRHSRVTGAARRARKQLLA